MNEVGLGLDSTATAFHKILQYNIFGPLSGEGERCATSNHRSCRLPCRKLLSSAAVPSCRKKDTERLALREGNVEGKGREIQLSEHQLT
ncbi:hypothetical protein J6590_052847 [Homalodisca vitripennis]|nr:hypothetical protein J6590_052847 [Homalodisca vitripennis]